MQLETTKHQTKQAQLPSLWKHQSEAIRRAKCHDYFALYFEAGTGKTRTLIDILRAKFTEFGHVIPTLIICPPVVISNWEDEWLKYSKVPKDRIVKLYGTEKERIELMVNAPENSIFITNYESLLMKKLFPVIMAWTLQTEGLNCIVLDEAHKIKETSSKRSQACHQLAKHARFRYALTGTPILNSLMDVYSQWKFLDRGERFGTNFYSFRFKYFEDKNKGMPSARYFPDFKPQKDADKRIRELIESNSMIAFKKDCLDLPPLVKKVIKFEMSKEQMRLYKSMKQDLVATINTDRGDKHSIAEFAITKALRLQQIASGHLRVIENESNETSTIAIKDNPRKKAFKEVMEECLESGAKVLVWAVFKDNYKDIREVFESLDIKYSELHGESNDREKQIKQFRENPEVRALLGHPGSGGIGVNLIEASYAIYYSRSFNLEFDIQSEARNYRGGSEMHEKITRIDLVAQDSIDELVLASLQSKQEISDSILRANIAKI